MFSTPVLAIAFISLQLFVALQILFLTITQVLTNCCITQLAKMADNAASSSSVGGLVGQGKEVVELYKAYNSGFGPYFLILFTQTQGICILYIFISLTSLFTASSDNLTLCLVLGYLGLALGQAVNVTDITFALSFSHFLLYHLLLHNHLYLDSHISGCGPDPGSGLRPPKREIFFLCTCQESQPGEPAMCSGSATGS